MTSSMGHGFPEEILAPAMAMFEATALPVTPLSAPSAVRVKSTRMDASQVWTPRFARNLSIFATDAPPVMFDLESPSN